MEPRIEHGDALLLVDVQNDFCPGGALPIPAGDTVVPVLNRWIDAAARVGAPVFASRDWHPLGHVSFAPSGGEWPPHCVQDTPGARLRADLRLPHSARIVTKGVRFDRDQLSAFDETGLADALRREGIRRVWVGGLAQDVCVRATVIDGQRHGFEMHVIAAGTKPVDAERGQRALADMRAAGAVIENGD